MTAIPSHLEWASNLDVTTTNSRPRKTSIICTIGPATNSVGIITELRKGGMNIVRLNMSHGSHEFHASVIENVRESLINLPGPPVAIALDTKGPEIRTGRLKPGICEVAIPEGHEMVLTTDEAIMNQGDAACLFVDLKQLPQLTEVGRFIFIDDGQLQLQVTHIHDTFINVRAVNSWKLSSTKCVNLPMTKLDLPAVSEKDRKDLAFGMDHDVDVIFASFIRSAADIEAIRSELGSRGQSIKLMAKIENFEGVDNFDAILEAADGVMIARSDLAVDYSIERVFILERRMIARANLAGKPIICATQVLESTTRNARPMRAEVSDVASSVLGGVDGIALSSETARGVHPIESVSTLSRICHVAESIFRHDAFFEDLGHQTPEPIQAIEVIAQSAVRVSIDEDAAVIFVFSETGELARLVSKYRPRAPIVVVSTSASVSRQILIYRGCVPYLMQVGECSEGMTDQKKWVGEVVKMAVHNGLVTHGDFGVVVSDEGELLEDDITGCVYTFMA